LLALLRTHRAAFQNLASRLVPSPRQHLGRDADPVERVLEIVGLQGKAERRDLRLGTEQNLVGGRRDQQLARSGARRQVHRHPLAALPRLDQNVAKRRGRGARAVQALDLDEQPGDASVVRRHTHQLAQGLQRQGAWAPVPEGQPASHFDHRPVDLDLEPGPARCCPRAHDSVQRPEQQKPQIDEQ
jgi:hypothetical protein